jgi:hypothetical protein
MLARGNQASFLLTENQNRKQKQKRVNRQRNVSCTRHFASARFNTAHQVTGLNTVFWYGRFNEQAYDC